MSLSGLKDVDREILKYVDDRELLRVCHLDRKTWNEVCDDAFLRRRLSKYPGIEQYKRKEESWKEFFLRVLYYIAKMKEEYEFDYESGDFIKQYGMLKFSYKDEQYYKNEFLIESAIKGELSLMKYVIKNGTNIHVRDEAALKESSRNGHLEVVKYLVEQGANIHLENDYPLRWAARNGHLEVVKYFTIWR